MADAEHLRSVHLDLPRRQDFRRAREILLNACGPNTRAVRPDDPRETPDNDGRTMIQHMEDRAPPDLEQWLMDKDSIYPLKPGVNTIGRLPDNDVVINGPYVSRRHCAILVHSANACELHDIASKNGTYLNGRPLGGPTRLATGDEIRMCDRNLVFVSRHAPARCIQSNPDQTMAE